MSFGLSPKLVCAATAALLFGTVAAQASEATLLADRAGFLLGHAHRCGIADVRLQRSEAVIGEVIAAFALDDEDRQTAKTRFAEGLLASALADLLGDSLPSCRTVGAELARLERHRPPAIVQPGKQREEEMARDNQSKLGPPQSGDAAEPERAKARKPTTTRPEELTPERRAELEQKRAAQQVRGRPPSI